MLNDSAATGRERRRAPRVDVALPVFIHVQGLQRTAKLHNLSASGAMLESASVLPRGSGLVLSCGTIEANATVVWNRDNTFGVRFAAPVRDAVVEQQVSRSQAIRMATPRQA